MPSCHPLWCGAPLPLHPSPAQCPSLVLPGRLGHGWVRDTASCVSLQIQRLAVRCIQKNLVVFQAVRHWPWWQLLSRVRPLLSVNLVEEQLRAKEVCTKRWDGMGWDGTRCFRGSAWCVSQIGSHFCQGRDDFLTIQKSSSVLSTAFFALNNVFCRAVEGEITLLLP